jgi:hypothetical protein
MNVRLFHFFIFAAQFTWILGLVLPGNPLPARILQDTWRKDQKDKKGMTWGCRTKGGSIKLIGFHNIEGVKNEKKKEQLRKTVDKDTPLLILPSKQVVLMPMIIQPGKKKNKLVLNRPWGI